MLIGPIMFDPTDPATPPRLRIEIVGYFTNPQQLAVLLAKMSGGHKYGRPYELREICYDPADWP
jgi:hypothetical protein